MSIESNLYVDDAYLIDRKVLEMFNELNVLGVVIPSTGMPPTLVIFENGREIKRINNGREILNYLPIQFGKSDKKAR